ncbi:caspase domain-containing protein [Mycena alexandri]|uniref:Caspase domain-containing protein n=1 Tax=Mycena alexandri TaxID=1745969 RepID=A0AAD6WZJ5_9AGAR|nr:caspase domain-containing protein [Mycena alexandri]
MPVVVGQGLSALELVAVAVPPDTQSQPSSPSVSSPVVQKKALLVGICGLKTRDPDYAELKGSHNDVYSVRDLLIELQVRYGYKAEDITILMDKEGYVEPTRDNILNAIKTLVKAAKAGDHFCFHYCGHSTQVLNRSHTEEDGKDECIIPYDGKAKFILDNELNEFLVKPLPAGAYLVAVLDTCHSGTLLDLKHGNCNQVYVPWISRSGEPRLVRRNGKVFSPSRRATLRTSSRLLAQPAEINMNLICRSPPRTADSGPDAGDRVPTRTYTYRSRAVSLAPSEKENDAGVLAATVPLAHSDPSLPGKFWVLTEEDDDKRRCDSPVSIFACNGFCRDAKLRVAEWDEANVVKADVVSLASCADSETTYEDKDGKSMTAALVEILRRDPSQSVKDVLISISHAMYTKALLRHTNAKTYKTKCKEFVEWAKHELSLLSFRPSSPLRRSSSLMPLESDATPTIAPSPTNPLPRTRKFSRRWLEQKVIEFSQSWGYDMDNLQNPQLASARPLDMNRQWKM